MNAKELMAAAEWAVAWYEDCLAHDVTLTDFERGHGELARAYLAEHREDDDEPVTEGWLRCSGFQQQGELVGWSVLLPPFDKRAAIAELFIIIGDPLRGSDDGYCVSIRQGVPDDPSVPDDHLVLTSLPPKLARGHVRRLCASLGLALTEQP